LIHAHGTGTVNNDPAELAAIQSALPERSHRAVAPAIYSHKGALGHSLGAAGLIAVVINAIAHAKGIIPPNVQTRHPLPMDRVELHQTRHQRQINRSVALAAGFGGACAAVSLVSR
jgi:3-oxoacyl-[acyl-carrier-protein] synthase II